MKTKLFAFVALLLLPLGMAAQSDPVEARLKAKYDYVFRCGEGTSTYPFWYNVKRDGKEGACDADGREIFPPRYDDVCLLGEGTSTYPFWYEVTRDGKKGACDANGREVIPPKYDVVSLLGEGTSTNPFWYEVKRDGKWGACDANGREIIPPKYDNLTCRNGVFEKSVNGKWVSLGIKLEPETTANTGDSSTSKLLYKGKYTLSGEAYNVEEKKWVNLGSDETVNVEIYNDHINMKGYRFDFALIDSDNNSVIYEYEDESDPDAIVFRRCLMNASNYNLTYEVFIMRLDLTFVTIRFNMAKGVVKMPRHKK